MTILSKTAPGLALAASLSMAATPAVAADLPQMGQGASSYAETGYASEDDEYERHRRWRYRRHRTDVGDVIAGIAIIGGIAAIASAASRNDRYRDRRYRDYDRRYRYDDRYRYDSQSIDRAVDRCTAAVSRDVRVEEVDSVNRAGEGWQVRGRLYDGSGFTCNVGRDGRIDSVDYGAGYSGAGVDGEDYGRGYQGAQGEDNQWSDSAYARARNAQGMARFTPPASVPARTQGGQPAYPGGPLPGEEVDGDIGG